MIKNLFRYVWYLSLFASTSSAKVLDYIGIPAVVADFVQPSFIPVSSPINLADHYTHKTLAVAFRTADDIKTRQIIYEQGGSWRGINMYIENGNIYMNLYTINGNSEWLGYHSIIAAVQPNTDHVAIFDFKGTEDLSGSITGYLDGVQQGQVDGIGILQRHPNEIGVGMVNKQTVVAEQVENKELRFMGLVKRVIQLNHGLSAIGRERLSTLMMDGHDQDQPKYPVTLPVLLLEQPTHGAIESSHDLNLAKKYQQKSLVITFKTAKDIQTRQVLFEQGGSLRGMNMYIEAGQLYVNAWSMSDGEHQWGYKSIVMDLQPQQVYQAALVLDGAVDASGTLTAYLNSIESGTETGVGLLMAHPGGIGVGEINGRTVFAGVSYIGKEYKFLGQLFQVAEYNSALTEQQVTLLADLSPVSPLPHWQVAITSPPTLTTVGYSPVMVNGKISGEWQTFTVNGVPVEVNGEQFSIPVALTEGFNTIIARATSQYGYQYTDSINVSLDLTPPYLTVDSHTHQQSVYLDKITVTGLVNDIVRGTVEESQAAVEVNGVVAKVLNRSYAAIDVPLVEGENVLNITGVDQAGNSATISRSIFYQVPNGPNISVAGGQHQSGVIGSLLALPLQVFVEDDKGQPVVDQEVVFRVVHGGGIVGVDGENYDRATVTKTNELGIATTKFQLGYRAGTLNHRVRAQVVGYETDVAFYASGLSMPGDKISINSGNNQRGMVDEILPAPLVVVVTDAGANVVQNARVRFSVVSGAGSLVMNEQQSMEHLELFTDSDGRAAVNYRLGEQLGLDQQRVVATLLNDQQQATHLTAAFMATAFIPGEPGKTAISGAVLDNQEQPIPGVTIRIEGTDRTTTTNEQGRFKVEQVPVGPVHLVADGSTATISGEFPVLNYYLVTVSGIDNPLAGPIYMVKLDTENAVYAGPTDVSLTLDEYSGFQLDIAQDSITFPDGDSEGFVSVTVVNANKVPMAPPNGMQPQFIVTVQPTGATFDPPARLSLPNVDGHLPGAQVEMYSFDHDLEEFVAIGLGTVSEDGAQIRSNPGVGVIKAGWHCGSQPGGSGTVHHCGTCFECDGVRCVRDQTKDDELSDRQITGDCKSALCKGTKADPTDVPDYDDQPGDCRKMGCDGDQPTPALEVDDNDLPMKDPVVGDCQGLACDNGEIIDVADDDDIHVEDSICLQCLNGSLVNKADGSPVNGEPCKVCMQGEIGNKPDGSERTGQGESCTECRDGLMVTCEEDDEEDIDPSDYLPAPQWQDELPGLGPLEPDASAGSCPVNGNITRFTQNPVSLSGAKHFSAHCLSLGYKGQAMNLALTHDSTWVEADIQRSSGIVGPSWTLGHTQGLALQNAPEQVVYLDAAGRHYVFTPRDIDQEGNPQKWLAGSLTAKQATVELTLDKQGWLLSFANGDFERFDEQGFMTQACLTSVAVCFEYTYQLHTEKQVDYLVKTMHLGDLNHQQNRQTLKLYIRISDGRLIYMRDAGPYVSEQFKRQISLAYDQMGRLVTIVQADGSVTNYEYDQQGYITAQIDPNMQVGSGTLAEGWRHEIIYEPHSKKLPARRVAQELWRNDQGQVVRQEKMLWQPNSVTLQTWDMMGDTPQLVLEERFDFDDDQQLVKRYLPNSSSLYDTYIYCKTAGEPAACGGIQNHHKIRRILLAEGSKIEYQYDQKGRLISRSRGQQ